MYFIVRNDRYIESVKQERVLKTFDCEKVADKSKLNTDEAKAMKAKIDALINKENSNDEDVRQLKILTDEYCKLIGAEQEKPISERRGKIKTNAYYQLLTRDTMRNKKNQLVKEEVKVKTNGLLS